MDERLDTLAAKLPASLEPKWITEVVRAFGAARGLTEDNELLDYWQEAVLVAIKKTSLALKLGKDPVAFLKRGVRLYLIDLNRKLDVRRATVETLAGKEEENAEEYESRPPVIEDFDRSAFDSREENELKRLDDVRVALYATIADSPDLTAYWRAYRETSGSDREIAKRLGISHPTVATHFRKPFLERFKENYLAVRKIRGKVA